MRNNDLRSSFKAEFCQQSESGLSSSTGLGGAVELPIKKLPFKLGLEYDNARSAVQSSGACSSTSSNLSDGTYTAVLQELVDPNIVAAWSSCKQKKGGFVIDGELNGNVLVLTFRFLAVGSVSSTKVIGTPTVIGASCPKVTVSDGTQINTGGLMQQCFREGSGAISVIANSDFQPARFFVPAVETSAETTSGKGRAKGKMGTDPSVPSRAPNNGNYVGMCVVLPTELPHGTPKTSCPTSIPSGECKCPKFKYGPNGNLIQDGTYRGIATKN